MASTKSIRGSRKTSEHSCSPYILQLQQFDPQIDISWIFIHRIDIIDNGVNEMRLIGRIH